MKRSILSLVGHRKHHKHVIKNTILHTYLYSINSGRLLT